MLSTTYPREVPIIAPCRLWHVSHDEEGDEVIVQLAVGLGAQSYLRIKMSKDEYELEQRVLHWEHTQVKLEWTPEGILITEVRLLSRTDGDAVYKIVQTDVFV